MKKLLVVLTVLAMATAANATFKISVNSAVDPVAPKIKPGDTMVIGATSASELALYPGMVIFEGSGAAVDSSAMSIINLGIGPPGSQFIIDVSADATYVDWVKGLGFDPFALFYWELIDVAVPPRAITAGQMIDGLNLSTTATTGEIAITLFDAGVGTVLASQRISQIPEPMTLALLGLGGLFLRRRK